MILRGLAILGRQIQHAAEDAAHAGIVQMDAVARYVAILRDEDEMSTSEEMSA